MFMQEMWRYCKLDGSVFRSLTLTTVSYGFVAQLTTIDKKHELYRLKREEAPNEGW
jgi:hypothetical protein